MVFRRLKFMWRMNGWRSVMVFLIVIIVFIARNVEEYKSQIKNGLMQRYIKSFIPGTEVIKPLSFHEYYVYY